nr:ribonuclease H-like domain-containing protein [Tanacetum cinerariifolium]
MNPEQHQRFPGSLSQRGCNGYHIRTGQIIRCGTERGGLYYVDEVTTSETVMLAYGTSKIEAWLWYRSGQGEEQCDTLSWLRYTTEESCPNQNTTSAGAQEQSSSNISDTEDTVSNLLSELIVIRKLICALFELISFELHPNEIIRQDKMSRDVITVGSTMRHPLLYRGEYSQWRKRFMNYLEEKTDGEAMINSIQNGDQPLPVIAPVSLAGTAQNASPTLKDPKFWTAEEKKIRKIDHLARSLLIQGLPNDIYSLIDSNKTSKDLWDALERQMRGSEYGEQDRKAAILKDYCELNYKFLNNLQPEWKHYGDVNDALGYKKKVVVVTSDPLALVAEKTKAFNQRKFYFKPTNNNLRTSSTSQSANKKQEFVKSDDKKEDKKTKEKKRDMSKVKCYNCKKEGHFAKDCKKAKVKDYNYYKTKMLLAKT